MPPTKVTVERCWLHGMFAALLVLAAACGSAERASHASSSPLPAAIQDASDALTNGSVTSDCVTQPKVILGDAAEASTGYLGCHATLAGSDREWTIKVFAYERDSYAKAGYRRSCKTMNRVLGLRGWTIWQQGQNWYAELSATGGKAPRSVAETFAHAPKSTAWDDCSGLR